MVRAVLSLSNRNNWRSPFCFFPKRSQTPKGPHPHFFASYSCPYLHEIGQEIMAGLGGGCGELEMNRHPYTEKYFIIRFPSMAQIGTAVVVLEGYSSFSLSELGVRIVTRPSEANQGYYLRGKSHHANREGNTRMVISASV